MGALDNIAELAVNKEVYATYQCPECGEVSFFTPKFEEEKIKSALRAEIGVVTKHPRFKEFLSEDASRRFLSSEDIENSFFAWFAAKK